MDNVKLPLIKQKIEMHYSVYKFVHAYIITSERGERSSYKQSFLGHLDDIQTAIEIGKN